MTESQHLNRAGAIAAGLFALALSLGACASSARDATTTHCGPASDLCHVDYHGSNWYVDGERFTVNASACPAEDDCQPNYSAGRWTFPRVVH